MPEFYVASSINELRYEYEELSRKYDRVCVKFASDAGGKSYRLIDNSINEYEALFKKSTTRLSFSGLLNALGDHESFPQMIVMPHLPGKEASIDCLMTGEGLIAVSRIKTSARTERVEYRGYLIDECRRILEKVPLENPCNVQYKYMDGKPYLLEENTRMSGGIHMTCAAAGVNIPAVAVNKLLGMETHWEIQEIINLVTQVEIPVILQEKRMERQLL